MITEIRADVKITPKIKDTYYSFSYGETRSVAEDCDIEKEKEALFDDCYNTVYNQIQMTMQNS